MDQLWIQHVLGPQQRERWYDGEYIFNVSTKAIDEHCEKTIREVNETVRDLKQFFAAAASNYCRKFKQSEQLTFTVS